MRRVLIVGASALQVPLIRAAKARGHWVVVADRDPQAVGIAFADAFSPVSTVDADAVARAAVEHAVHAVVTAATDQPLPAVARALAARGLPGLTEEVALVVTRKDLMRQALGRGGVPCPRSCPVANAVELKSAWGVLPHPVIVKPVDSSGSHGVTLVVEQGGLESALTHALAHSRAGRAVAEEFMVGREFSVETLSVEGRLRVLQVTEKQTSGPPHFVESGHFQPANLTPPEREALEGITAAAARVLGIETGPTHTEVMLTPAGPRIVEVGARLGGDYITSDLLPLSTGIDMVGLTLELALGQEPVIPEPFCRGAAIRYLWPRPGRITRIEGATAARAVPGLVRLELFKQVGHMVGPVTGSRERVGYVIASGADARAAVTSAELACSLVRFDVE